MPNTLHYTETNAPKSRANIPIECRRTVRILDLKGKSIIKDKRKELRQFHILSVVLYVILNITRLHMVFLIAMKEMHADNTNRHLHR